MFGSAPYFINCVTAGSWDGDPRVRYLLGVSSIAGWSNLERLEEASWDKAWLIREGKVALDYDFVDDDHQLELIGAAYDVDMKTLHGLVWTVDHEHSSITFCFHRDLKGEFQTALDQADQHYRDKLAEQAGGGSTPDSARVGSDSSEAGGPD